MKLGKLSALASALAVGLLMTGCGTGTGTFTGLYQSKCQPFGAGVVNPNGVISASIDAPLSVKPGETFTVKVNSIGVQDANVTNPPPANAAGLTLSGPSDPTGNVPLGSLSAPPPWPTTTQVTVTGQPGQTIHVGVAGAGRNLGLYAMLCLPATPPARLVSIPIVAP